MNPEEPKLTVKLWPGWNVKRNPYWGRYKHGMPGRRLREWRYPSRPINEESEAAQTVNPQDVET